MPLIYSSVSQGLVTLAEYAAYAGNFGAVAKDYLAKAGKNEGKFTYNVDGHTFNFLNRGGFSKCPQPECVTKGSFEATRQWEGPSKPPRPMQQASFANLRAWHWHMLPWREPAKGTVAILFVLWLQPTSWWRMRRTGGPSPRLSLTRLQASST